MDTIYRVETPELIEFEYAVAGIGSRFLAAMIDTLIIALGQVLIGLVIGLLINIAEIDTSILTAVSVVLSFAALWGYYVAFELLWNGQTPGKRMLGLRVVREGARPITPIASVIRNLIRIVDFLPFLYGVGVVAMFVDRRARRLGDLAAGVLVVRERGEVTLASLTPAVAPAAQPPAEQPRPAAEEGAAPQPGLALSAVDYALVEEFLSRRTELGQQARARLAGLLAAGLGDQLGPAGGRSAEQLLIEAAAAYQLQQRGELAAPAAPAADAPPAAPATPAE